MVGRLRRLTRRFGFDVARFPGAAAFWPRVVALLQAQSVTLVVDVGANTGQYAMALLTNGYGGRIVSYEPGADAHAALTRAAAGHAGWDVAPRGAVGGGAGEVTLNVSGESDMSSLLPMTAVAAERFSGAATTGRERVPMVTLADELPELTRRGDRVFVKSDTQGYEAQVLAGLGAAIDGVAGLQLELSLVPVYEGQPLYLEMLERLAALGFTPHLIIPGYYSRHYGRMLEFDVVAFRD